MILKEKIMNRRTLAGLLAASLGLALMLSTPFVRAADEAPDALIKRVSAEVLDAIKADKSVQAGDMNKVIALVDSQVMPNVNFVRMTAAAVGRNWRQATPEQKKQLQAEFKTLLIRTYSGTMLKFKDAKVTVRDNPVVNRGGQEVIVRTEVVAAGGGKPVNMDYTLYQSGGKYRVYNVAVEGASLVTVYRNQFGQTIGQKGIDGLIADLKSKNGQ